jgi:hypothetical protein
VGVGSVQVRSVENFKSSRDAGGWQPSQNLAFLIIAGAMFLGGVLAFLL